MTRATFSAALLLALSLQRGRAAAAQPVAPGSGPSFMFFRYASHTSLSLYGGYGVSSCAISTSESRSRKRRATIARTRSA